MSLVFNNKRIGFNGKRLAKPSGQPNEPDEPVEEYCPNCGEVWDGVSCGNCGYPDNEDPGDDPFDPGLGGDDPWGGGLG